LEIVFANILYNSIDALEPVKEEKKIHITTQQKKYEQEIIFHDNGCGMDKSMQKNIFKPFYTTKTRGMGLGLSNVERIVYLHKGKINIKSRKNKFTEFKISLPC